LKSLVFVLALLPQLASAQAQDLFGAIAYSNEEQKHGWANNYPSRKSAEQAAMKFCHKNAPKGDCRPVLWFRNSCGALVTGPDGHGAEWATNQTAAVNKALKACARKSERCAVTLNFCTGK
jgi:hypothetical protein